MIRTGDQSDFVTVTFSNYDHIIFHAFTRKKIKWKQYKRTYVYRGHILRHTFILDHVTVDFTYGFN